MDIEERIQMIMGHEKLTISSFARQIGVPDQTIRGIVIQHRNKPGYALLLKICKNFEWLNVEWLITGKGEMLKKESSGRCLKHLNSEGLEENIKLIVQLLENLNMKLSNLQYYTK